MAPARPAAGQRRGYGHSPGDGGADRVRRASAEQSTGAQ